MVKTTSVKLDKINIKNYRGILEEQEVSFGNFSTLVGKNDAGKSIILHAINLFLDEDKIKENDFHNCCDDQEVIIATFWSDSDLKKTVLDFINHAVKKNEGHEDYVDALLVRSVFGIRKLYKNSNKKASKTQVRIEDYEDGQFRNLWNKQDVKLKEIIKELDVDVPAKDKGRNSKAEQVKHIRKKLDERNEKKNLVWVEDVFGLSGLLPGIEFFQCENPIEIGTPFRAYLRRETKEIFEEKSENLSTIESRVEKRMNKEADEISTYMKDHVPNLEGVTISPVFDWPKGINDISVQFKFLNDTQSVPMENKGSGYRRLFMVGRFQYLASKKSDNNTIYLIEEPETFLHPSAQQQFLDSLITLSEDDQIIISSHSPVFAGASEKEFITLCKKEFDSEKTYSTYTQQPDNDKNNEFLHQIINELGVKPEYNLTDVFEAIVFMEGKNDIEFLKIAAKKLGKEFPENKFLFLPGGGCSLSDFVNITWFSEKQTRPLFLIIDSDIKSGDDGKYEQNKEFKKNFEEKDPKNRKGWLLQKSEIENYYHPAAIEKVEGLKAGSVNNGNLFQKDDDVKEILTDYHKEQDGVSGFQTKNRMDIFEEMTEQEWEEVSEGELEKIINTILDVIN